VSRGPIRSAENPMQITISTAYALHPCSAGNAAARRGGTARLSDIGVALALPFSLSRWVEVAFFLWAVVLQVTPIVAIAPLAIVWTRDEPTLALLTCASIVAFFPILSNTALDLRFADRNLVDLLRLCGASRWQELTRLRLPAALPYFLGGLRISGGLALIGTIVAESVADSGGAALRALILNAGYRLQISRMSAALFLVTASGVAIFSRCSPSSSTSRCAAGTRSRWRARGERRRLPEHRAAVGVERGAVDEARRRRAEE